MLRIKAPLHLPIQAYRKTRSNLSELLDYTSLWQKTFKVIGGKFGTSVLSYFSFLRWLLKFNIFSFVMNFSFLIIPQFTVAQRNTRHFTGLEFFTGAVSALSSAEVHCHGILGNATGFLRPPILPDGERLVLPQVLSAWPCEASRGSFQGSGASVAGPFTQAPLLCMFEPSVHKSGTPSFRLL